MNLLIIIPAYNEEKRIGNTLNEYLKYFKKLKNKKLNFEILVVINNTTDNTPQIVESFKEKYKELDYLNLKIGGKGYAIIEGFKYSLKKEFDLIGFVDADISTTPEEFYKLVENIGNYDGIIASRWMKNSKSNQSFLRKIQSRVFNFIVRSLFLFNYKDTQCGAKIFRKKVIQKIINGLRMTQWAFDINLLYLCKKYNFKIKEFPTKWIEVKDSKINLKTPVMMFFGVFRLRIIYSPFGRILRPLINLSWRMLR